MTDNTNTPATESIMAAAQARAAAIMAKAEQEARIIGMIPDIGLLPLIVIQTDAPWICYTPDTLAQILTIWDAFDHVQALDCKKSYRRVVWDGGFDAEKHGEIICDYAGWLDLTSRCPTYLSGAQDASFRFFARLSDGSVAQINIDLTGAYWGKAGFPVELRTPYRNSSRSGRAQCDWSHSAPLIVRHADQYITFGTGADRPGQAAHYRAFYSTRAFVAEFVARNTTPAQGI